MVFDAIVSVGGFASLIGDRHKRPSALGQPGFRPLGRRLRHQVAETAQNVSKNLVITTYKVNGDCPSIIVTRKTQHGLAAYNHRPELNLAVATWMSGP